MEELQQQLFVLLVLCGLARVQLKRGLLEERKDFGQGPQLDQVQEVEVAKPLRTLPFGQLLVKALLEL